MIIDHFGWLGVPVHSLDGWRVLATFLLLAGGYLIVK